MASNALTKTQIIENYLRTQIKNGVWKTGDVLPKSKDLAKKFNSSEFILREAMQPLIKEGILGRKTRVGTFVLSEKKNISGNILILSTSNQQYDMNSYTEPNYIKNLTDVLTKNNQEYKVSIAINGLPNNELLGALHVTDNDFTKHTIGVINLISCLPTKEIEEKGIPCITFSGIVTNRTSEIIFDIGSLYYQALNQLSNYCDKIAVFRNDYSKISSIEGEYSINRDNIIEEVINDYKNVIVEDIQIDFYSQTYLNIYNTFKNTITNNSNIKGVFIADPSFIPAIHHAISDMGLDIPKDLKIFCYSIKDMNYGFDITWDRIEQDFSNPYETAYNLLISRINDEDIINKKIIYPNIVKGNSL